MYSVIFDENHHNSTGKCCNISASNRSQRQPEIREQANPLFYRALGTELAQFIVLPGTRIICKLRLHCATTRNLRKGETTSTSAIDEISAIFMDRSLTTCPGRFYRGETPSN